ncbi:acetyltransferase [Legionella fallonii]|uniref:Acyltransferase n=1 Tax=Legionella fallonii LLAP-10 TaxID=1212491 RepID=A0A098G8Q9_9GAMM|nr:acetyltransferase [Legionella fallonii]CEG58356.1 Acyltransferase [Legionella fallonii LLAP-10]
MKKIILAGNAITANILHGYLSQDNRYEIVGLTVDDDFIDINGVPGIQSVPLSDVSSIYNPQAHSVIMAMGYNDINRSRESMFNRLKAIGYQIESYIHPDAKVYTHFPLGEGCVILPSAVIEPHVQVGANSMIWANVTLAHHSSIEEHCWIASGAVISGQAKVKRNSFIGVNATIVNEIVVDEYSIIGAGALITKNTKPSSVHLARSGEELRYSAQEYVNFFGV